MNLRISICNYLISDHKLCSFLAGGSGGFYNLLDIPILLWDYHCSYYFVGSNLYRFRAVCQQIALISDVQQYCAMTNY